MGNLIVAVAIVTSLFVIGIVGIVLFYVWKKKKFALYTESVKEELGKVNEVERAHSKFMLTELAKFANWLHASFPDEFQIELLEDKEFLKIKAKYMGKDEDFFNALGAIAVLAQKMVAKESQDTFDKINKLTLNAAKDIMMKETK